VGQKEKGRLPMVTKEKVRGSLYTSKIWVGGGQKKLLVSSKKYKALIKFTKDVEKKVWGGGQRCWGAWTRGYKKKRLEFKYEKKTGFRGGEEAPRRNRKKKAEKLCKRKRIRVASVGQNMGPGGERKGLGCGQNSVERGVFRNNLKGRGGVLLQWPAGKREKKEGGKHWENRKGGIAGGLMEGGKPCEYA